MKYLMALLLMLIVVVSLVPLLLKDPGYVLIHFADTSLETTVTFLLLMTVLSMAFIFITYRLLKLVFALPDFMYVRGQQRYRDRAQDNFYQGLKELAEGHWKHAEKLLISSSENSKGYLLAYLGAACAAQYQGEHERRDHYLKLAHGASADAVLATGITQAELQIDQGQYERALATINQMYQIDARNKYILEMQMQLYLKLHEWDSLQSRIPELRELNVIDEAKARELEVEATLGLLRINARQGDAEKLLAQWNDLAPDLKRSESIVTEFCRQWRDFGAHDVAEPVLRQALEKGWSHELALQYAQLEVSDKKTQLDFAESWSQAHAQHPMVQLALARIYLRNQLKDKAREHLESSIELGASMQSYFELGGLLEQLEDRDAALRCYRHGLALGVSG